MAKDYQLSSCLILFFPNFFLHLWRVPDIGSQWKKLYLASSKISKMALSKYCVTQKDEEPVSWILSCTAYTRSFRSFSLWSSFLLPMCPHSKKGFNITTDGLTSSDFSLLFIVMFSLLFHSCSQFPHSVLPQQSVCLILLHFLCWEANLYKQANWYSLVDEKWKEMSFTYSSKRQIARLSSSQKSPRIAAFRKATPATCPLLQLQLSFYQDFKHFFSPQILCWTCIVFSWIP